MNKKEINIFSVSFLDLLSGALAAVIILFIVIPKMSQEQIEAIQTLERLEIQVEHLDSILILAKNSIPREIYEQIQANIQQLNETIEQLNEQVRQISEQLRDCEQERQQLAQQLEQTQQQLAEAQQRMKQTTKRTTNTNSGPGRTLFGVNAKFAIVITWPDNFDVDLHVFSKENREWVYWNNQRTNFGVLLNDVRNRRPNEDIYELFYQTEIVPGNYEVYIHLYSNTSQLVTVSGYISLFPFTPNEKRLDLPAKTIQHSSGKVKVGTVYLSNNNFTFNP